MEQIKQKMVCIVNGYPSTGKDTFINLCMQEIRSCKISTIDIVKIAMSALSIPFKKDHKWRKFSSNLKDMWDRYYDGSFQYVEKMVSAANVPVIFVIAREPDQITRLQRHYGDRSVSVYIENKNKEGKHHSNHADMYVENYDYDYKIHNNSSIQDLEVHVHEFIDYIEKNGAVIERW